MQERKIDSRFLRGEMGKQSMRELAVQHRGESVQESVSCLKRHEIIGTDAMGVHYVVIRENVCW
jgi:hypothetical protein